MKLPIGKYCEVYGATATNKVLEFFLEAYDSDIAVSEIVELSSLSKPKIYQVVDSLLKKGIVMKSRVVGRTQFYRLNKENMLARIYVRNFRECLKMMSEGTSRNGKNAAAEKA